MEFKDWTIKVNKEITAVANLMNIKLSDDLNILEIQIRNLESHNYRMASLCCEADWWLSLARAKALKPKSKELSDLDRDVALENDTKDEQLAYAKLKYLIGDRNREGVISKRISVAQSFMANHRKVYDAIR
jgi:hypothetical protein